MAIYSIFTRSDDPEPRAVADRFSWFAALLPPVYALVHGLWWGLLAWVAAVAGIVALGFAIGGEAGFWLYTLLAVFIGFEGGTLRRVTLGRRGFAYRGERIAAHEDQAEASWLSHQP
jgi:hypothetical protein